LYIDSLCLVEMMFCSCEQDACTAAV